LFFMSRLIRARSDRQPEKFFTLRAVRTALPSAEEYQVSENTQHQHGHDHREQVFRIKQPGRWEHAQWDRAMTATMLMERKRVATGGAGF
jgi:hypothetical protein